MKKFLISTVVVSCVLFFAAVSANAYPNQLDFGGHVNFNGNEMSWSVWDSDSDLLNGTPPDEWSGVVNGWDPIDDVVFDDIGVEYIKMSDLVIDPSSKVTESVFGGTATKFNFNPEAYEEGFQLYDDDGTLLFKADLVPVEIVIYGVDALVNPLFNASLTNIVKGDDYTYGTSGIVDSFLDTPSGVWNVTTNFGDVDLVDIIENGGTENFSYSGIADPVPEPATILLFGAGLLGLAAYGRKKVSGVGNQRRRA